MLIEQIDNNHSDSEIEYSPFPMISIKHSLPKPNDLIKCESHQKKSLYSFPIQNSIHEIGKFPVEPLFKQGYNSPVFPKPISYLNQLTNTTIIYDKMNSGLNNLSNESVFPISRIKLMAEYENGSNKKIQYPLSLPDELQFDSAIQSGNLNIVCKTQNRQYNLLLRSDINTKGYNNWFYFRVKNTVPGTYKFNIINYKKAGTLFNQGNGILTYSQLGFKNDNIGWVRAGENISYTKNGIKFDPQYQDNNFTLSFEYKFTYANDVVYFSYSYPYTYTRLCEYLEDIDKKKYDYFHKKLLTRSLYGNRVELLTITSPHDNSEKRAIIIMARVHPGETCSSWVLQGFLDFIVSQSKEAQQLRQRFIFKIIPMLNPDGVIHGNFRCSLSGRDLNRVWKRPNKSAQPEIYYAKLMIQQVWSKKGIWMLLDLHGHSRMKKIFMYGCGTGTNYVKCRQFPYLLSKLNQNFQYRFCNFSMEKYKQSTARVTFFKRFKIPRIYTLETSVCGNNNNHFTVNDYQDMGVSIAKAIHIYSQSSRTNSKKAQILNQLRSNDELLNMGNDPDGGSESQPSLDNVIMQQSPTMVKPMIKYSTKRDSIYSSNNSRSKQMHQRTQNFFNPITIKQRSTMSQFPRNMGSSKISPTRPASKIQSSKNRSQVKIRSGTSQSSKQTYNFVKTQVFVLGSDLPQQYDLLQTAASRFRRFLRSSKTKKLIFKS